MRIELPAAVALVVGWLEAAGFEAYIVGGCVRDSLLGDTPADWDVTTSARPEQVVTLFVEAGIRVIETGLQHGTVTVVSQGEQVEVTTYRVDGDYSDGRRPDGVAFVSSLRDDLARRDFTINAMAYHPQRGLVDLFGGVDDLRRKRICCVGDPMLRFGEDYLRILRAFRFAARLGFALDAATQAAAEVQREGLRLVAPERIHKELDAFLPVADAPMLRQFFDLFGALLLPELAACRGVAQHHPYHIYDVYDHILAAVAACPSRDLAVKWALLLHDVGKPACKTTDDSGVDHFYRHPEVSETLARQVLRRLRYDNGLVDDVCQLVKYHDLHLQSNLVYAKKLLAKLGQRQAERLCLVRRCDALAQSDLALGSIADADGCLAAIGQAVASREAYCLADLAVTGEDVMAVLGLPPSAAVGAVLRHLLEQVVTGTVANERAALLVEVERQRR